MPQRFSALNQVRERQKGNQKFDFCTLVRHCVFILAWGRDVEKKRELSPEDKTPDFTS